MEKAHQITSSDYQIRIEPLEGLVEAFSGDEILASSRNAKIMYETRLDPVIYFPVDDVLVETSEATELNTFCPFKGTASYKHVTVNDQVIENALWYYERPLPESRGIENHVAFMPHALSRIEEGSNAFSAAHKGNISGPTIDWILREAWLFKTPQELTKAIANKLIEDGVAISRMSVLIWSLHPMIAGKNYVWTKATNEVREFTPSYDIHSHPAYMNSPLRFVSSGLGGVRQRLTDDDTEFSFPIMEDLKAEGATDYVAMPLPFSNGQTNVMTLACDHPKGFTTPNLGLVFEISSVISRYYEVFNQTENSQILLETYLGKRTGTRVLGGEIRRGDGEEIKAAILFCDLRNSTRLEEQLGRDQYLGILNEFFDQTTSVINENNGEVLKFIGDAVLAIFQITDDNKNVCGQAKASASEILRRIAEIGAGKTDQPIDCAIGIAFGEVTYGNVGSKERLDFTVIGRAANVAARLSELGKTQGHRVMMTKEVGDGLSDTIDVGRFDLRNVSDPVDCYALDENA